MKNRYLLGSLLAVAVIGTIGYVANLARASGIPAAKALSYSGVLTDPDGKPLTGVINIQIRFWDNETSGTVQCDIGPNPVTLAAGAFQLLLPENCASAVHQNPDLWVEPMVNGSSLGRTKLGAVPFALEASHAVSADTASGPLKTTVDGLVARGARIVRAEDNRAGCPPKSVIGDDLITLQFTLAKPTPVYFTGGMIRQFNGRADISLIVDGAQRFIGLTETTSLVWTPAHAEWAGTLAAGNHTASIRNGNNVGAGVADIWGCGPGFGALTAFIFE